MNAAILLRFFLIRTLFPVCTTKVQHEKSVSAVIDPLRWVREREVVHFQRIGEILNQLYEWKDSKEAFR